MYSADMVLGGQSMTGFLDTGSYEILVFSQACATCGTARRYNSSASSFFVAGDYREEQSYGSGTCTARDARDTLQVGPFNASGQHFWEALRCNMDILEEANFNAVVGIGPPGEPEYVARKSLETVLNVEKRMIENGQFITSEMQNAKVKWQEKILRSQSKIAMLDKFNIRKFSTCLGRRANSPGWFVWNDTRPIAGASSPHIVEAKVAGMITWSVQMMDFHLQDDVLHKKLPLGCKEGCGAILDTGSSFFGVPTNVYMAMMRKLGWRLRACSDLRDFPDLVLRLGGRELHFPPGSYVGKVDASQNFSARVGDFLHLSRAKKKVGDVERSLGGTTALDPQAAEAECRLLLLDTGDQKTQLGPMYILGMPFFREYYTTFDLGQGSSDRAIFLQLAGEDCRPIEEGDAQVARRTVEAMHSTGRERARTPRLVDLSAARIPLWLGPSRGSFLRSLDSAGDKTVEL